MKPNPKMLFGNFFDDEKITPHYLARFADDVIAKLVQNNTTKEFDIVLTPLQTAIAPLRLELGQVDTSLRQVVKTATVDGFIDDFANWMSDNYVFIASAMGGEKHADFKEFYPKGKSEYTTITKTNMETVTERLKTLSNTHKTKLGTTVSAKLLSFQTDWTALRKSQLQQKSEVKTNRSDRSVARRNVEMALLKTINVVAGKYPADVEKCKTFFDFHLLFGVHHTTKEQQSEETAR